MTKYSLLPINLILKHDNKVHFSILFGELQTCLHSFVLCFKRKVYRLNFSTMPSFE